MGWVGLCWGFWCLFLMGTEGEEVVLKEKKDGAENRANGLLHNACIHHCTTSWSCFRYETICASIASFK